MPHTTLYQLIAKKQLR